MPRTKGGTVTRARCKKITKLAKGYRDPRHLQFKIASTQVFASRKCAFRDRRKHESEFRKLWIARINAATRQNGLSYPELMRDLKVAGIGINRKILADIAYNNKKVFTDLADAAKEALN